MKARGQALLPKPQTHTEKKKRLQRPLAKSSCNVTSIDEINEIGREN